MKYRYKRYSATITRPVVPILVRSGKQTVRYEVLIDSGADICLFDWEIAELLGIEPKKGNIEFATGIAGQAVPYFTHEVELEVNGQRFTTKAGFIKAYATGSGYGIVGQIGFFDAFQVNFDKSKEEVTLE